MVATSRNTKEMMKDHFAAETIRLMSSRFIRDRSVAVFWISRAQRRMLSLAPSLSRSFRTSGPGTRGIA